MAMFGLILAFYLFMGYIGIILFIAQVDFNHLHFLVNLYFLSSQYFILAQYDIFYV
jgi:hypothetical protein